MLQQLGRVNGLISKGFLLTAVVLTGCTTEEDLEVSKQTQACIHSSPSRGVFAFAYSSILLKKKQLSDRPAGSPGYL